MALAVESPSLARRTSRWASAAGPNASRAASVAASPVTYGSRWPRPWQVPWHGRPSWTITTWPSSTPVPLAPRKGRPLAITPPPSPVPIVSITTFSTPRAAPACHSPIAAAFASLSSPAGRPNRRAIQSRSGKSARGRFTHSTTTPRRWSIGEGAPKPTAPTSSPRSSATATSSSRRTESCESCGVARSCRRSTRPSRATTPARIFVPPRSTPIACVALMPSGYRNPPNGRLRREAVPRLQGRPRERQGAAEKSRARDAAARSLDVSERRRRRVRLRPPGRAPPALRLDVEALDLGDAPDPRRAARDLVGRRLPLGAKRRQRCEQAALARHDVGAREAELAAPDLRHEHPAAWDGSLHERAARPKRRRARRLDDAAAHGSRPPPAGVPVDSARPADVHTRTRR